MLDFFKKIIDFFNTHHIPYMVSGSIAMGVYIVPRATKNIDFVVHLNAGHVDDLVTNFTGAYYCTKGAVTDAISRQSIFNIIDHASGFKADFVVRKNTEYRITEFERRKLIDFYGTDIYIVSPEDLLISKLIWIQEWQAAVQIEDIKNLSLLPGLEVDYINYWINRLKLNTFDLISW